MHLAALNLIIYYFLQLNSRFLLVFHCWDVETHMDFVQMAAEKYLFVQLLHLNRSEDLQNFEYRYLSHKKPVLGAFLDMNCEQSTWVLERVSNLSYFSDHFYWLIFDGRANIAEFRRYFADLNLAVDAELTFAIPSQPFDIVTEDNTCTVNSSNSTSCFSSPTAFTLYDVYNNGRRRGGKLNMTIDREINCNAKICYLQKYLSTLHLLNKYGHRSRLHDITLRVGAVVTEILLPSSNEKITEFLLSERDPTVDTIARYSFQTFAITKDFLGCNVTYIWRNGWSIGEASGGIIGDLADGTADLITSPLIPTPMRSYYFHVGAETRTFRSVCLFRTPVNTGIRGDVFLRPFSLTVWIVFGMLLLTATFVLWTTFVVEYQRLGLQDMMDFMPSFVATLLITFGSACIQGSSLIPRSMGGRCTFFLLYMTTFIMYNYYTSIVVSTLLGTPVKSDIKTVGQLADSSLEVGLDPLPYTYTYLNNSQLPEVRRFVEHKIESKSNPSSVWMPVKEGIIRVRDERGFVYIFEASTGYPYVKRYYKPHEICDLNEVMLRPESSLYVHVHKNSSYKQLIKMKTTRMLETGVYERLHRFWVPAYLQCYASNFVVEVEIQYMAPLFYMLLSAYLLVLLILLVEIGYKRYVSSKKLPEN